MKVYFSQLKNNYFNNIFLYQTFLTLLASFFITFNKNYFEVFIDGTFFLIIFLLFFFFIIFFLNKIFFFKFIFQNFNQEIIIIFIFSLNFVTANYAIYFLPLVFFLIFFVKKNKLSMNKFLIFFLIISILFSVVGILKKTLILNEDLVYKDVKNSKNINSHSFFKKNFFIIVLDQHPSSSFIKKNLPDSNFFAETLKNNKFYVKDLKSGEGFDTIYAMYKFFNPMTNFENINSLSSELYSVFKGNNFLNTLAKKYDVKYLFLDGSSWDSGLLRCDPDLVDECITPISNNGFLVLNINYFFNYVKSLKINKIINISRKLETILHSYDNLGDLSWNNYRGLVSDFYLNVPNLKIYEPFVIYSHFLNPHEPYSRNENCNKFSKVFQNKIKFEKFLICTQKLTLELVNIIEDNYPDANILIMSDTPAHVVDEKQNIYKEFLNQKKIFFAIKSKYLDNFCKKNLNQIKEQKDILIELNKCLEG